VGDLTVIAAFFLLCCLAGALWSCWLGRERSGLGRRWLPFRIRVIYAPRGRRERAASSVPARVLQEPRPEGITGKLAYTDQVLAQSVSDACRRVEVLAELDARLRKPASSLRWAAKA
jgi:hypothetical protein